MKASSIATSLLLGLTGMGGLSADAVKEPVKILKSGEARDALIDRFEHVRGDSGKWRDDALLQAAPSLAIKPEKMPLDEWADELIKSEKRPVAGSDTWLIFRTRQLDDNDRLWIQKIERRGEEIEVVMNEAIWQGYYSKTFTWYGVYGVNLGNLPAGKYRVRWVVNPLEFEKFKDPKDRRNSWPADELSAGEAFVMEMSFMVTTP